MRIVRLENSGLIYRRSRQTNCANDSKEKEAVFTFPSLRSSIYNSDPTPHEAEKFLANIHYMGIASILTYMVFRFYLF